MTDIKIEARKKTTHDEYYVSYNNSGMREYCRTATGARRWFRTFTEAQRFAEGLNESQTY